MARIKLTLPEKFIYATELDIRIGDINYGNHLANDKILLLLHEARVRFLKAYGLHEGNIGDGVGLVLTDAVIVYKSQGFWGEKLQVKIALDDFTPLGCDIYYVMLQSANSKEIARAKTNMAGFSFIEQKLCPLPESFKKLFT